MNSCILKSLLHLFGSNCCSDIIRRHLILMLLGVGSGVLNQSITIIIFSLFIHPTVSYLLPFFSMFGSSSPYKPSCSFKSTLNYLNLYDFISTYFLLYCSGHSSSISVLLLVVFHLQLSFCY